ncbi:MAG: GNAT family N-acetyltransferase [Gammaproteobacteria bacterium]
MLIRPATLEDVPGGLKMLAAAGLPIEGTLAATRVAASQARESPSIALVAVDDDGKIAGGIAFDIVPSLDENGATACVQIMAVAPAFQRRGIGRLLLDDVERRAWESGCGRVEIVPGVQRPEARAFYTAQGYRKVNNRMVKRRI